MRSVEVFVAPQSLQQLADRPINGEKDITQGNQVMEELKKQPARCQSCVVVDCNGRILVAYLGLRSESNTQHNPPRGLQPFRATDLLRRAKPISELYENATRKDMSSPDQYYDGLPEDMCKRQYEATQRMAAYNQPSLSRRDVRHIDGAEDDGPDPRLVRLPHHPGLVLSDYRPADEIGTRARTVLEGRSRSKVYPDDWQPPKEVGVIWERTGVYHHCHACNVEDVISPSKNMTGSGIHAGGVRQFFLSTKEVTIFIAEIFKQLFPQEYKTYAGDFESGIWIPEDRGPFLCHATVYKLQVHLRREELDVGPTISFPTGYFKGGAIIFTDLRAKFEYSAGHICFSMTHHLYHAVEKWEAIPCPPEVAQRRITPGRISTVHFMHLNTLQELKDKPRDWLVRTNGGVNSVIHQPPNPKQAARMVKRKEREADQKERRVRKETHRDEVQARQVGREAKKARIE
ncbi:hypothetical protein B0H16DRAFT_91964 [Mycena metata]|uniref:Uncharacterized protein n=1 Tax=Mycena metata TaxID=1033252 RepID=A0AAD7IBL7_9AGAR|nr:hypothetical protein B0H16DRAFT_91964 [Mycena metata]